MENEIMMPTWMNKSSQLQATEAKFGRYFFVKMSLSQRFGIVSMGWALLSQEHISKVHRTSQIRIFRVLLLSSNYLSMQS